MKILLDSLGCDKNLVDSENMLSLLISAGFEITCDPGEADIIIINTCCFIDRAKEESINAILEAASLRQDDPGKIIIAAGCLSQRYPEEIRKELPEVDGMIGAATPENILAETERILAERGIAMPEPGDKSIPDPGRVISTGGLFEYLKISEGCSKNCTYCVIPQIRGPYRSRPMEEILSEAEDLAEKGVKELILVAQETTLYGKDIYRKPTLHILLRKLCEIEGFRWIRIMYTYPEDIYPELLETIASEDKICNYLDIPVQHINDEILARMNRHTTGSRIREILKEIRNTIPGIALRTTVMTGFPGETEEMHEELLSFIKEFRFERLGAFIYSPQEGTAAYGFNDRIDEETSERRYREIMELQQEISRGYGSGRIGQVEEILVEGVIPEDGVCVGRTYRDAPEIDGLVFADDGGYVSTGDMLKVKITGASEYDVMGVIENGT